MLYLVKLDVEMYKQSENNYEEIIRIKDELYNLIINGTKTN